MSKISILTGLRWAAIFLLIQLLIAVPSYLHTCKTFTVMQDCSIDLGTNWIMKHAVYSDMILAWPLFGFLIGTFGGLIPRVHFLSKLSDRTKGMVAWFVIILLIAIFAAVTFQSLPDLLYFWKAIQETK